MNSIALAKKIFLTGVDQIKPDQLIQNSMKRNGQMLEIDTHLLDLTSFENVIVLGFGKASGMMAKSLEKLIKDKISEGLVIVKYGHEVRCKKIEVRSAAHPYPDQNGIEATSKLRLLAEKATENDLIICLISGGGSSLLTDMPEGSRRHFARQQAERAATRTIIALRFHERRYGRLPESLNELADRELLEKVPEDPFGKEVLKYSRDRRLLWSVGPDGQDNYGVAELPEKEDDHQESESDYPPVDIIWNLGPVRSAK